MDLGFRIARKYWHIKRRIATAMIGPMPVSNYALSVIASTWDNKFRATPYLVDLSLQAAQRAKTVELDIFKRRQSTEEHFFELWPGEHYRLLSALCGEIGARTVIEVGTLTGTGTLSLAAGVGDEGTVHTFDILPWDSFEDTWLTTDDFASGRVKQHLDDLSDPDCVRKHSDLIENADLIFLDGPKDNITEAKILKNFETLTFKKRTLMVFDDILTFGMAPTWYGIKRPKLDITSFGHWTGTGMVDWCGEH